jgi:hypothetical protein
MTKVAGRASDDDSIVQDVLPRMPCNIFTPWGITQQVGQTCRDRSADTSGMDPFARTSTVDESKLASAEPPHVTCGSQQRQAQCTTLIDHAINTDSVMPGAQVPSDSQSAEAVQPLRVQQGRRHSARKAAAARVVTPRRAQTRLIAARRAPASAAHAGSMPVQHASADHARDLTLCCTTTAPVFFCLRRP